MCCVCVLRVGVVYVCVLWLCNYWVHHMYRCTLVLIEYKYFNFADDIVFSFHQSMTIYAGRRSKVTRKRRCVHQSAWSTRFMRKTIHILFIWFIIINIDTLSSNSIERTHTHNNIFIKTAKLTFSIQYELQEYIK